MARHETEMRWQRDRLRDGLVAIANQSTDPWSKDVARATLLTVWPPISTGLFETERQMDFADRTDLKR